MPRAMWKGAITFGLVAPRRAFDLRDRKAARRAILRKLRRPRA